MIGFSREAKDETEKASESENEVFFEFTGKSMKQKKPMIDTGASKSVISEKELQKCVRFLPEERKKLVLKDEQVINIASFKFGTGSAVEAERIVELPVNWRENVYNLKLNVMEDEVPLPVRTEAVAKMLIIIDLKRNMMETGSTATKLGRNQMGHLKCDDGIDELKKVQDVFWTDHDEKLTRREIQKIRANLAGASPSKMIDLLMRTKKRKLMTGTDREGGGCHRKL